MLLPRVDAVRCCAMWQLTIREKQEREPLLQVLRRLLSSRRLAPRHHSDSPRSCCLRRLAEQQQAPILDGQRSVSQHENGEIDTTEILIPRQSGREKAVRRIHAVRETIIHHGCRGGCRSAAWKRTRGADMDGGRAAFQAFKMRPKPQSENISQECRRAQAVPLHPEVAAACARAGSRGSQPSRSASHLRRSWVHGCSFPALSVHASPGPSWSSALCPAA